MIERKAESSDTFESLWWEYSKEIERRFGLQPSINNPEFHHDAKTVFAGKSSPIVLNGNKIRIPQHLIENSSLHPLLVAKACLESGLSGKPLCQECVNDLSFEFARQQAEREKKSGRNGPSFGQDM